MILIQSLLQNPRLYSFISYLHNIGTIRVSLELEASLLMGKFEYIFSHMTMCRGVQHHPEKKEYKYIISFMTFFIICWIKERGYDWEKDGAKEKRSLYGVQLKKDFIKGKQIWAKKRGLVCQHMSEEVYGKGVA